MRDWKKIAVGPTTSILEAVKIIDAGSVQIALVVDAMNRLVGTVTDGDIRRGILKGVSLEEPVARIMNVSPTVATTEDDIQSILLTMNRKQLLQVPIVDAENRVIRLHTLNEMAKADHEESFVVLMAGGLGLRLRPLTENIPKPMLKIGGKPVLEKIITNLLSFGFKRFYVTVHYRAAMLEQYFGDGSRWGAEIRYVNEPNRLGTAGALAMLPDVPAGPVLVMNADLLTEVNFHQLLMFHSEQGAQATMCVRQYDFQVPYGVVNVDRTAITEINEKPNQRFCVNAGIYVLNPEVLTLVQKETYLDMNTLFEQLIRKSQKVSAFALREKWIDIGAMSDFARAQDEFDNDLQYEKLEDPVDL